MEQDSLVLQFIERFGAAHILAAALAALIVYDTVIYNLFISPLRKIPGPKLAAMTRYYLIYYEYTGQRTVHIHDLHMRYGPVVRIAPQEVSFNDLDALKKIYGAGTPFSKANFYDLFWNYGRPPMFSMLESKEHADRKRLVSNVYSKSNVTRPDNVKYIRENVDVFMAAVQEHKVLDVYYWFHYYTMDTASRFVYGDFATTTLQDSKNRQLVKDMVSSWKRGPYFTFLRFRTLYNLANKLFPNLAVFRARLERNQRMMSYCLESYNGNKAAKTPIGPVPKIGHLDTYDGAAEAMDHFLAGSDTTGDTLTFLVWQLAQPECHDMQAKLRQELLQVPVDAPFSQIDNLPYLEAVLKEGLRIYAAIPMSEPRISPKAGAQVSGYQIPGGVECSMQPYSLHRDPAVYAEPDAFRPERWIDCDISLHRNFWAFSSGPRVCIGMHLALVEMKMLLAGIYRDYKTLPGATPPSDMRMEDDITNIAPLGHRCEVVFQKLAD